MKRIPNALLLSLVALAVVSVCGAAKAQTQTQIHDSRVIVARAGGVNFVSGDVSTRREDGKWLRLSANDELKTGDEVRTGADGRVEVLLNPGSYLRAGGATEFAMTDASLEDLQVALSRGSAVVEATGYGNGGSDLSITITTPRAVVRLIRSGVYRIDVSPSGVAEVAVLKGRALVGTTLVKGGNVLREGAYGTEVAKLDKKGRDALDQWSKERGKELAKANANLSRRGISAMLARANTSGIYGGYGRNRYGLWMWNPFSACYTFAPYNNYWQSPYGYWYGTGVYFYPDPLNNQSTGGYPPVNRGGIQPAPTDTGSNGGKQMPPREVGPPRESPRYEPRESTRNESPRVDTQRYESHQSAPSQQSAPVQQSTPSQSMSAPSRAAEELPQRNAPPE
jgi:hypothetical protein